MLPSLAVVGAEKSGASALFWDFLHPQQVIGPRVKEATMLGADSFWNPKQIFANAAVFFL